MRFLAGIGTIAVVSAVSLVPVYGESPTTKEMNTRIKALQDRLASFRQQINTGKRKLEITGTPTSKTVVDRDAAPIEASPSIVSAPTTPDQVSDSLESRSDAKVIVLFHDTSVPNLTARAAAPSSTSLPQTTKTLLRPEKK